MTRNKKMKKHIKELHILLIYLNAWEEDDNNQPSGKIFKSWKGYPFDVLDQLEEKNYIRQHRGTHLISITDKGKRIARKLKSRYIHAGI